MRARSLWAMLLLLFSTAAAAVECDPVIAVGDLHGGYENFVAILREIGLVDEELRWSGGDACLVQTGDLVDRGPRSHELLELLMALQGQEPERVRVLLGNHEVMTLAGDLRYADPGEFTAFAAEETPEEREAAFEIYRREALASGIETPAREAFDTAFPPGWFARRRAFAPDGRYGSWLFGLPVALRIERSLFVHAGLSPADAAQGLEALNRRVVAELRDYLQARAELERAGWLSPLTSFVDSFAIVAQRAQAQIAESEGSPAVAELPSAVRRYLGHVRSSWVLPDGPLWMRELAEADEQLYGPTLEQTLQILGVSRVAVGHTPREDGRIASRFGHRVFLIDTGAGPAYGGHVSALQIERGGRVTAIYPGERIALVRPPESDAELERFFRSGRVIDSKEIGSGISRPLRLVLELDGVTMKAAFKTIDVRTMGVTRFPGHNEINFSDSYRYERAAYLVDRKLGLNLVPVCVLRELDGVEGALIEWISDSINEDQRRREGLQSPNPLDLVRQRDHMQILDALILNTDRHLANQLITLSDWKLYLIDHSRSFRIRKSLPKGYEATPAVLSRDVFHALRALDAGWARAELGGLLDKAQIRALLARRDRLVAKIESDLARFGEAIVFHPEPQPAAAASGS